jgi:hypothetical protein
VAKSIPLRHDAARFATVSATNPGAAMNYIFGHVQPIVALIAGILILVFPRLLSFIIAVYLIISGLVGLGVLQHLHFR